MSAILKGLLIKIAYSFILMITAIYANAQLKADFTFNKNSGCSPLVVSFTNTSTGASANAKYDWNFDNGSVASNIQKPSATYYDERTYIVTLTVTDGDDKDKKTDTITVYKKPVVNFAASLLVGCAPLPVTFTSKSDSGDGTVRRYSWDFGDGQTLNGTDKQTNHIYTASQVMRPRLTVTNSYGCFSSSNGEEINIKPGIKVSFTADKTDLCKAPGLVTFINNTTGPGTLSYTWDFKDGKTEHTETPAPHTFVDKAAYDVTLTVKNTDGCVDSVFQIINVANFKNVIGLPEQLCTGSPLLFSNKSTPEPVFSKWIFSDDAANPYDSINGLHTFNIPGTYKLKLVNTFPGGCLDSLEKTVTVGSKPLLNGFLNDIDAACKAPVTVKFQDSSKSAVQWYWDFGTANEADTSNIQKPVFTFTRDSLYYVELKITNADGCSADTGKYIQIQKPLIEVIAESDRADSLPYGCPGLNVTFKVNTPGLVKNFKWDFGDGGSSTGINPEHSFNGPDTFYVKLDYDLFAGCSGTTAPVMVITYKKPEPNFTSSFQGDVCGNTPVMFKDKSDTATAWYWDFGDSITSTQQYPSHAYSGSGEFTIKFVAKNYYCESDTVVKQSLIKTIPPFPNIQKTSANCTERGAITFTQVTEAGNKWTWNFGDQTGPLVYDSDIRTVKHQYQKSGYYKVSLTADNGICASTDTIVVSVFIKQDLKLTADIVSLCGSGDTINVKVSGSDSIYYNYDNAEPVYTRNYYSGRWEYTNGIFIDSSNYINPLGYNDSLTHLKTGKDSIRFIAYDNFYGCRDTSNFLAVKVTGPLTGFRIDKSEACFNKDVTFTDTSSLQDGVAIKTWIWSYGDSTVDTLNNNAPVKHRYQSLQKFYPTLRAVDANGCYGEAGGDVYININGIKANFYANDTIVAPGTNVQFYNTSDVSNGTDVLWQWNFGDSHSSTGLQPANTYDISGIYPVKLVAKDKVSGCTDSLVKPLYIKVKPINASFSYVFDNGGRSCPPIEYSFTNTSLNADSVFWNFGDNSFSGNNNSNPKHTYTDPGLYNVVMYAYGKGGTVDSAVLEVEVKGPYASVRRNISGACLSANQEVILSAKTKNTVNIVWDFRDGTVLQGPETFAAHTYKTPGIYYPRIIMEDSAGCTNNYALESIVIDSLAIKIKPSSSYICESGTVNFSGNIYSFAEQKLNKKPAYHWDFGTGNNADTSTLATPSFYYNKLGKYLVTLTVKSPYGCEEITTDTIVVTSKPKAGISPVDAICSDGAVLFKDNGPVGAGESWFWDFKNGVTSEKNNPDTVLYQLPGTYDVEFIKYSVNGCSDTAGFKMVVHPNPNIALSPKSVTVCKGSAVELTAHDGASYAWSPSQGLSSPAVAAPLASPDSNTIYQVKVTNLFGCSSIDSAAVKVAQPFRINVSANTQVCAGSKIQLNASGADRYQWTGDGLDNNTSANPFAQTATSTTYMVIGYDNDNCFTDTQYVRVNVLPVPTVKVMQDTVVLVGSSIPLTASGSSDIVSWSWSPSKNLSCSSCQSTIATAREPVTYTVTATNNYGCSAKDSVMVKLECTRGIVFIPNSFTPNNDGLNDVFYIRGSSVKIIKHLIIFNRWGTLIFEKSNFAVGDKYSAWDGTYKGKALPTGVFVYTAQLVCDNNEVFEMKGTVMIIR